MLIDMPALTHQQQQAAVERIHALMAEGMSSGEAIAMVSRDIRANHTGDRVSIRWDDDEDNRAEALPDPLQDDDTQDEDGYNR